MYCHPQVIKAFQKRDSTQKNLLEAVKYRLKVQAISDLTACIDHTDGERQVDLACAIEGVFQLTEVEAIAKHRRSQLVDRLAR